MEIHSSSITLGRTHVNHAKLTDPIGIRSDRLAGNITENFDKFNRRKVDGTVISRNTAINRDFASRRRADGLALQELARRDGYLLAIDNNLRARLGNSLECDIAVCLDRTLNVD